MRKSKLLKTPDAAESIGTSPSTLKLSRHTGELYGVKAPAFRKMGRMVFYEEATLEAWKDQFPEVNNTAEASFNKDQEVFNDQFAEVVDTAQAPFSKEQAEA